MVEQNTPENLMVENGRADLWAAIVKYYPGKMSAIRKKLGISQTSQENVISLDEANEQLSRLLEVQL